MMNEQEKFWHSKFGNEYSKRLPVKKLVKNNTVFFSKIFKKKRDIKNLVELGANNGANIISLKKVLKKLKKISAVEINQNACKNLRNIKHVEVHNQSISDCNLNFKFDLVLLKGVLIHINPNQLNKIYNKINSIASKYVLFAEYYNSYPIKINYRGYKNKLFKRDFAGEFIKKFKNFKIIDYGFVYNKDKYPQDDLTWFLMKKTRS